MKKKISDSFDLFSVIQTLTRNRGVNPGDYEETLTGITKKRWGGSALIKKDGVGIDKVFQEFSTYFPWMFDTLDDFVEALADRLGRKKSLTEEYSPEAVIEIEGNEDAIILDLQRQPVPDALTKRILDSKGLIKTTRGKRKVSLTGKAVKRILEISLEEGGSQ